MKEPHRIPNIISDTLYTRNLNQIMNKIPVWVKVQFDKNTRKK